MFCPEYNVNNPTPGCPKISRHELRVGISFTWFYQESHLFLSCGTCWWCHRWYCQSYRWSHQVSRWKERHLCSFPSLHPTCFSTRSQSVLPLRTKTHVTLTFGRRIICNGISEEISLLHTHFSKMFLKAETKSRVSISIPFKWLGKALITFLQLWFYHNIPIFLKNPNCMFFFWPIPTNYLLPIVTNASNLDSAEAPWATCNYM